MISTCRDLIIPSRHTQISDSRLKSLSLLPWTLADTQAAFSTRFRLASKNLSLAPRDTRDNLLARKLGGVASTRSLRKIKFFRKTSEGLMHKSDTLRDRAAYDDGSTHVRAFEFARRPLRLAVEARTPSRVESLAFCALSTAHGDSLARGEN